MEFKISDHLDKFYQDYNLGIEGGNHLSYVTHEIFNVFNVYIPNWDNRRKAVLKHNIHHLLTGYKSELLGEFEITAWEIASGCMNYFAAYLLNSAGIIACLLIYAKPSSKAFLLGCRSTNLYQLNIEEKTLKNSTVDDLKKQIGLKQQPSIGNPSISEILKLISHILLSIMLQIFIFILSPLLIVYNFWMYGRRLF